MGNLLGGISGVCVVVIMLLAGYAGMSRELCRKIDTYSLTEQEAMGLNSKVCKEVWFISTNGKGE